jgi:methionyl-tRNA formyltransferase
MSEINEETFKLMAKPRIIFMGTPPFALPALETLGNGNYAVAAVVTQPDRPAGRGRRDASPPVKQLAVKLGLEVLQPVKVRDASFLEEFYQLNPDMVVVTAFGQILPKEIIDFPRFGCLNIHPSLLPKYRGAAPLNWSIIRGETKTGVTIMLMDEGMDSGDIIIQEETPLGEHETFGELHDRLAIMGAKLLVKAIDQVIRGQAVRQKQDPAGVTFAPRLTKETARINWHAQSRDIFNLIRGLSPSPAAYTTLDGQELKIFSAETMPASHPAPPGTIAAAVAAGLPVAACDGYLIIREVQPAGKKRMPVADFLRGRRLEPGKVLG